MNTVVRMPPRGRYPAWEVGQLAGVSGQTIGQWARRRYIRSSVSARAPRIYSFQDVAEAMVVHELEAEHLDEIRRQLTRGGWAVRSLPDLRHIELDPDRLSGRPTIRGRRIAAGDVAEMASAPGGVELLREDYELDEEEIADARRWWREVRRLEQAAA